MTAAQKSRNVKFTEENFDIAQQEENQEQHSESPCITDPEWTDYVLSLLINEEKINGNPSVAGLRRVAELLLGQITESVSHVDWDKQTRSASVVHSITFGTYPNFRKFDGAADCGTHNTESPYCNHPVASAETMAEGRALKRALKLRTVVAEELGKELYSDKTKTISLDEMTEDNSGPLTSTQEMGINNLAKKLNINVLELINTNNVNWTGKNSEAKAIFDILNSLQKNPNTISQEVKGYEPKWNIYTTV